jgi:hypothetical protein
MRNKKYMEKKPWLSGDRYIDKRRTAEHDLRRNKKTKNNQSTD